VRALVEAGEYDEACTIAKTAIQLTDGLPLVFTRKAKLGYAIALSLVDPKKAIPLLEASLAELAEPYYASLHVAAQLYLTRAWILMGESAMTTHLESLKESLRTIGREGLQLLAGPSSEFKEVFGLLEGATHPLELRFLGSQEVRLNGSPLRLRKRFLEILAELALAVYGERSSLDTVRSDLSRLREIIPITATPYRIQVAVRADFLELQRLIMRGKAREALRLYQGPLLTDSDSETLVSERQYLSQALRSMVVASQDPEAIIGLAEKLKDDLELWEKAAQHLPKDDPRWMLVQARIRSVAENWA
jgi:hypothetical protein